MYSSNLTTHKSSSDHDNRYYTESEIDTKLNGKSNAGHTHDDRYYTESEVNNKFNSLSIRNLMYCTSSTSGRLTISGNTANSFSFNINNASNGYVYCGIFALHINGAVGLCIQSYGISGSTITAWVNNFDSWSKEFTITAEYFLQK